MNLKQLLTPFVLALAPAALAQAPGTPSGERPLREEIRELVLRRFDANKDGKLDEAERAAARAQRQEGRTERSPRAEARPERREQIRERIRDRVDRNDDGRVDDGERAAAREHVRRRLAERRERMQGERGPTRRGEGRFQAPRERFSPPSRDLSPRERFRSLPPHVQERIKDHLRREYRHRRHDRRG